MKPDYSGLPSIKRYSMSVKVSSSLKVTLPGNTIFEDVVNLTEDA